MTTRERDEFYTEADDDHQPVAPEPAELVQADWDNAGRME